MDEGDDSFFWEKDNALSLEEGIMRDIASATCVTAELFLFAHLKTTLPKGMSLTQRVNHLKVYMEEKKHSIP